MVTAGEVVERFLNLYGDLQARELLKSIVSYGDESVMQIEEGSEQAFLRYVKAEVLTSVCTCTHASLTAAVAATTSPALPTTRFTFGLSYRADWSWLRLSRTQSIWIVPFRS